MSRRTEASVLADLAALLAEFHGVQYSGVIGPQTRFFADLGLASIDAVVLGETLERHYEHKLPFAELLADLGRRQERDLTMGELAAFLIHHLDEQEQKA
jgi:acyl carrier protein